MVKRIKLEWDEWNVNHIAKHGVSRREVEVVIEDPKKDNQETQEKICCYWFSIRASPICCLGKAWEWGILCCDCERCNNN